jgi:hypothetical protein
LIAGILLQKRKRPDKLFKPYRAFVFRNIARLRELPVGELLRLVKAFIGDVFRELLLLHQFKNSFQLIEVDGLGEVDLLFAIESADVG